MKEIEKNKRISKYINILQPPSSPTSKQDKTEEAGKQIYRCKRSRLAAQKKSIDFLGLDSLSQENTVKRHFRNYIHRKVSMENFVFGNLPYGNLENALNRTCFRTNLPDLRVLYVLILVQPCQIWAYFMFLFQYNPARFRVSQCYFFITTLPGLCLIHVLVLVAGLLQKLAKETECPICLLEMKGRVFQCVSGRIIPVQGFNRTPVIDLKLTHTIFRLN